MKKKTLSTLLIALVALAMLALAGGVVMLLYKNMPVAFADEEYPFYIKAVVSDLEGNEFAGAGTISVSEKDGDREFFIPESYYIEIVGKVGKSYYKVNYVGQELYIPINTALTPSKDVIREDEQIYPDVALSLTQDVDLSSLEGIDSSLKKLDATYTINFLGYAADPATPDLIYVMATPAEGKTLFGFIPRSAFEPFNVPYQARAQAERDELLAWKEQNTPPPAGSLPVPEGSLALKIILILGISLPAVIIVILLFVPSRRDEPVRKSRGSSSDGKYYDDPARRQSDRQSYDQSRNYGGPRDGYAGDPYGGNAQPPYGNDRPPYGNGAPYNDPYNNGRPYGNGGYDPRMDREVRGYDPDDYDGRR